MGVGSIVRSRGAALALLCLLLWSASATAAASDVTSRAALLRQYQTVTANTPALASDLYLRSEQSGNSARGDVFAVVNYPFSTLGARLRQPATWCSILLLHFNVKACVHARTGATTELTLYLGRKYYEPPGDAYRVKGRFRVKQAEPDFLHVLVASDGGPLGLKNYAVVLRAAPMTAGRTLLSFSYSFSYGDVANWLMHGYFATFGRDKVGFTTHEVNGKPELV
ncbi:MAG: hypothetical protein P8124_07245, partial [Gammaproteobacteria bacterium]